MKLRGRREPAARRKAAPGAPTLLGLAGALAITACIINPQPLPPDQSDSGTQATVDGDGGTKGGGGGDSGRMHPPPPPPDSGNDAGYGSGGEGGSDSGGGVDAAAETGEPLDAGEAGSDASSEAGDAGVVTFAAEAGE